MKAFKNDETALHTHTDSTLTKFTLCALTLAVLLGVSGCSGDDGKDGAMGAQGVAGQDGADGANGVNGQDGTNGTDGSDGMDGNDGAPGFAMPPLFSLIMAKKMRGQSMLSIKMPLSFQVLTLGQMKVSYSTV